MYIVSLSIPVLRIFSKASPTVSEHLRFTYSVVIIVPALSCGYASNLFIVVLVSASARDNIRFTIAAGISSIMSTVSSTNNSETMSFISLSVKLSSKVCCISESISTKVSAARSLGIIRYTSGKICLSRSASISARSTAFILERKFFNSKYFFCEISSLIFSEFSIISSVRLSLLIIPPLYL